MKRTMPQTLLSSQINVNYFFLQTNAWISYITKSHFRSVERFWTHLHIANNVGSYHGLSWASPSFPGLLSLHRVTDWLSSPINRCVRKKALGTKLSRHVSLLNFWTQQEQTDFIGLEVGKAVARARKKNIQAKG